MYERFFGLSDMPFRLTPDPAYLFLDERRREALEQVAFGVGRGEGFFLLVGEVGMGKTTLCHALLRALGPSWLTSFVFHTIKTPQELLRSIMRDFGDPRAESTPATGLIDQLNRFLLARHAEGKVCLLVIDEAQGLSNLALELLRMLSNLETKHCKLVRTLLVGQPEVALRLSGPDLRQLDQRISVRTRLPPLSAEAVRGYIEHRLRVAGPRHRARFADDAYAALQAACRGNPRLVNLVADRGLLAAYARTSTIIESRDVARAVESLCGDPEPVGDLLRLGPSPRMSPELIR